MGPHTRLDCLAMPSPAPCYPVLLKNNHLGSVNLTQCTLQKQNKKLEGRKPRRGSPQKVSKSRPQDTAHRPHTGCHVCMDSHLLGQTRTSFLSQPLWSPDLRGSGWC